jgi:hypothetical protein
MEANTDESHLSKRAARLSDRVAVMRIRGVAGLLCLLGGWPAAAVAQDRPNFSGVWTLPSDAAPGPSGKPTGAPGFGPEITIWHDGNTFTVTRLFGGAQKVPVTHRLDGSETRSRMPGRLCEGDGQGMWTAAWDQNAVVTTMTGSLPPGAGTPVKMDVKTAFRAPSPDTMTVEMTLRAAGAAEPRVVATTYKKSGAPQGPPPAAPSAVTPATLSQIEWLAGTWIGGTGPTALEERWTPPGGGTMLAVARTLRNGVMNAFEFLCIVQRNGGLVYTAMPNGRQPATDFTLTKIEASSVTFENPSHDFPKVIRYTLGADGTLEAQISGAANQKAQTFRFKKAQ